MHTFKVASRIHLSTTVPYKNYVKRPRNNKKRHLYIDAYIAAPTAVKNAAIDIKNGHGLTETK
jgi:predicted transcriptional regulator of viral defense system